MHDACILLGSICLHANMVAILYRLGHYITIAALHKLYLNMRLSERSVPHCVPQHHMEN